MEKQKICLAWSVRRLLDIVKEKKFKFRVSNTALAFFSRFYLRQNMAVHSPQTVLCACIIAAIKAENLGELVTASYLFGGAGQAFSLYEVLKTEPVVLQTLGFDLLVLHPDGPFQLLFSNYFSFRRCRGNLAVPSNFKAKEQPDSAQKSANSTADLIFSAWLRHIQDDCEDLYLRLYETDAHFLFLPGEMAIGIFTYIMKGNQSCTDIDEYILGIQPDTVKSDPARLAKLKNISQQVHQTIADFLAVPTDIDAAAMDYQRRKRQ